MTAIECKLIREGGTFADIGGIEYHFAPQPDGAHVAQVADEEHADRFLSIDGYRLYRGEVKSQANAGPSIEQRFDAAMSNFAASAPIEPAPEVVTMLGSTEDDTQLVVKSEPAPVDERAALAAEYESLYGEAPHARTGIKKLREMIAARQTV